MLLEISSRQLSEWMAFYSLEPFGFESEMYGHGITASTLMNINKKKGVKAFTPQDFIPVIKEVKKNGSEFFQALKTTLLSKQNKDKK